MIVNFNLIRNLYDHNIKPHCKYTVTYQLVHVVPSGDADISIVALPGEPGLTTAGNAKAKNFGSLLKWFLTTAIRTSMSEY